MTILLTWLRGVGKSCGPGGALGGAGTVGGSTGGKGRGFFSISLTGNGGGCAGTGAGSIGNGILLVLTVETKDAPDGKASGSFSVGGDTGSHSSPFLWCWPLLTGNCIRNSLVRSSADLVGSGTEFWNKLWSKLKKYIYFNSWYLFFTSDQ